MRKQVQANVFHIRHQSKCEKPDLPPGSHWVVFTLHFLLLTHNLCGCLTRMRRFFVELLAVLPLQLQPLQCFSLHSSSHHTAALYMCESVFGQAVSLCESTLSNTHTHTHSLLRYVLFFNNVSSHAPLAVVFIPLKKTVGSSQHRSSPPKGR